MLSWVKARWRVVVAASAVVALVATVGIWSAVQLNTTPPAAVDCSTLEAETFNEAAPLAHACGADVEVLAERTPWHTSYATSEKTSRLEVTTLPSRVQVDGEWMAPDDSLVKDEKAGVVKVVAPVFPMELNAGGAAGRGKPLGSITSDSHRLDVWFPLDLPVPTLSDSQAVYQLDKGIRLLVSVNADASGFLPVVELADAKAATRFTQLLDAARAKSGAASAGLDIDFTIKLSDGLRLTMDDTNSIHALDSADETVFTAPPPIMWDSDGEEPNVASADTEAAVMDRTRFPAEGDRVAQMGVTLVDDAITVSPDVAMLKDKKTVWPVYIDPGFNSGSASKWVAVRTGGFNGTHVNWVNSGTLPGYGTGYCTATSCNAVYKQRIAWQYSDLSLLAALDGADITKAKFRVYGQHANSCSAQTTTLWRTSDISGFTQNARNYDSLLLIASHGALTETHSATCGGQGWKYFDMLGAAQWAANSNSTVLNLALIVDQVNMTPWKRFLHTATLEIDYNRAPAAPTIPLMTAPSLPTCTPIAATSTPAIATKTPTISVIASDPDGTSVQTTFKVARTADLSTALWSSAYVAAMDSGSRQSVTVPASAGLVDGEVYAWRARAYDGALSSVAWSDWCKFAVDISAPAIPTVTADTTSPDVKVSFLENVETAGLQKLGRFTLSPSGATDVVSYSYGFNQPTSPNTIAATGGTASVPYTPTTTGTITLTVKAKDAAGNFSSTKTYIFKVATPTEDAVWVLDEGTGATAAGTPGGPLTISGAAWDGGPHALFESRAGDHALSFDGDNDAATASPIVDTTKSFVVSAHVWLNANKVGTGQFTALSQDGTTQSGFQLGYTPSCAGMPNGCWSFSMPDTLTGAGVVTAKSAVPVTGGQWTYLLAEHNLTNQTVSLWVCDIGTPTNPAVGDPVKSSQPRPATPWAASGAFAIGRGYSSATGSNWWPGVVDNVRVFSGTIVAESKIRRLCQGAEATDFSTGALAIDPTSEVTP